mmetsp:Transcript_15145/g.38938  ORF Transcript_15145/g.38938 Transcript_15145/m.38938 type:complete len:233 (+) Transcript_15145:466-1164(+)
MFPLNLSSAPTRSATRSDPCNSLNPSGVATRIWISPRAISFVCLDGSFENWFDRGLKKSTSRLRNFTVLLLSTRDLSKLPLTSTRDPINSQSHDDHSLVSVTREPFKARDHVASSMRFCFPKSIPCLFSSSSILWTSSRLRNTTAAREAVRIEATVRVCVLSGRLATFSRPDLISASSIRCGGRKRVASRVTLARRMVPRTQRRESVWVVMSLTSAVCSPALMNASNRMARC